MRQPCRTLTTQRIGCPALSASGGRTSFADLEVLTAADLPDLPVEPFVPRVATLLLAGNSCVFSTLAICTSSGALSVKTSQGVFPQVLCRVKREAYLSAAPCDAVPVSPLRRSRGSSAWGPVAAPEAHARAGGRRVLAPGLSGIGRGAGNAICRAHERVATEPHPEGTNPGLVCARRRRRANLTRRLVFAVSGFVSALRIASQLTDLREQGSRVCRSRSARISAPLLTRWPPST